MWCRYALVLFTTLLLGLVPLVAAGPGNGQGAGARPGGPPVHNRVLDLLDAEVLLNSDEAPSWFSEPFGTARCFTRVIVKTASEIDEGFLRCYTEWQFTDDDEFQPFDSTTGIIGDDVNPRIVPSGGNDASDVYGLRGRVRCDLLGAPDLGGGDPPPPATGSLTDVKVLLRRE